MTIDARSLCPVCLAPVPARHETKGGDVYLVKDCPDHGRFRTVVWRGEPSLASWTRPKIPSPPRNPHTPRDRGCPFDCGLCPDHGQHTCTALIEITRRCNLGCPYCFAESDASPRTDPSHEDIKSLLAMVMGQSGPCNIQISGGEPTVRDDLPEIVALVRKAGFPFVQLNTNGLLLGRDPEYARKLADAGLDSVFLQFDGTNDAIWRAMRGRPLLDVKLAAIDNLVRAGIGVVLVPVVRPGVNDHDLGNIVRLAASLSPGVRGVHFQPVSYFGRYPKAPTDADRMTLPEVMRGLEEQTQGRVRAANFTPPGCEHQMCSFSAKYMVMEDGALKALSPERGACSCRPVEEARKGADRSKAEVARQWSAPGDVSPDTSGAASADPPASGPFAELDAFLTRARSHVLSISGMAFQDAWTLDLERLRGCCIHVADPGRGLVPFCAYNLTSQSGEPLYGRRP